MLSLGCQHSSDRSRLRAGYASLSRDNQCTYCLVPTPNFFSASKNWKNHCNGSGETREKVYNPANKKKKKNSEMRSSGFQHVWLRGTVPTVVVEKSDHVLLGLYVLCRNDTTCTNQPFESLGKVQRNGHMNTYYF